MSSPRNWLWPESPPCELLFLHAAIGVCWKMHIFVLILPPTLPPSLLPRTLCKHGWPCGNGAKCDFTDELTVLFFYFLLNKSSSCAYFPRLRLPEVKCGLCCSSGFIKASESCLIFWGCKSGSAEISHLSIVRSGKNSPALFPQHVRSLAFNQFCCRVVLKPHTCQEGQLILGPFFFFSFLFLIFDWTKCLIATDVCRQWGCTNHPGRLLSI